MSLTLDKTHQELKALCGDMVGFGISKEFIAIILERIIIGVGSHLPSIPLPIKLKSGRVECQIKPVTVKPKINYTGNNEIEFIDFQISVDFILNDASKVKLSSFDIFLKQVLTRPKMDGSSFTLALRKSTGFDFTNTYLNSDLEKIVNAQGITLDFYRINEAAFLQNAQNTIVDLVTETMSVPRILDTILLLRMLPPVQIGFTQDYVVIYSPTASTTKPDCASSVESAFSDIAGTSAVAFTISPMIVYFSAKILQQYFETTVPKSESLPAAGIHHDEVIRGEASTYYERSAIRLRTENHPAGGRNPARINAEIDVDGRAQYELWLTLPPCFMRSRSDAANAEVKARGTNISIEAQAKNWTIVGISQFNSANVSVIWKTLPPPPFDALVSIFESQIKALIKAKMREKLFHASNVQFFAMEQLMYRIDPTGTYKLKLESDAGTSTSVVYGFFPVREKMEASGSR